MQMSDTGLYLASTFEYLELAAQKRGSEAYSAAATFADDDLAASPGATVSNNGLNSSSSIASSVSLPPPAAPLVDPLDKEEKMNVGASSIL